MRTGTATIALAIIAALGVDAMLEPIGIETFSWQWFLILIIAMIVAIWGFWPKKDLILPRVRLILPKGHREPSRIELFLLRLRLFGRRVRRVLRSKSDNSGN